MSDGRRFWRHFDASWVESVRREGFRLDPPVRTADWEARAREWLASSDSVRQYVDWQLGGLPADWVVTWIGDREDQLLWHLEPPGETFDAGYDLVAMLRARIFLLTHSNHRSGTSRRDWATAGTVASFLEFDSLVFSQFDLIEFVQLVASRFPQNHDCPT